MKQLSIQENRTKLPTSFNVGKNLNNGRKIQFLLLIGCLMAGQSMANAQIWKKVKDRVKQTVESKITQKSQDVTTNAMNKAEGAIAGRDGQPASTGANGNNTSNTASQTVNETKSFSDYKSYDFVPGDKIIFEPDISKEADAELPARFKLLKGNAEIQSHEGEKILHLDEGGSTSITPLMSTDSYLPEQFTVEFDMSYENKDKYMKYTNYFDVVFMKANQSFFEQPVYRFRITSGSGVEWAKGGHIRLPEDFSNALSTDNNWHHIAIYVNKNIGKVYMDASRVAASNTLDLGAEKMAINVDGRYGIKIKNFRLAAGGSDKYNKIITDGKFITHGILFDVAKASIKPESAGTLNEVIKMMKAHPELKFEIDGHTDSDGQDQANLELSQQRAAAVKDQLVKMGISEDRLTTKGFGETKPIDTNDTQEGKANNRRVEFIKM